MSRIEEATAAAAIPAATPDVPPQTDPRFACLGALPLAAAVIAGDPASARIVASNALFDDIYGKAMAFRPYANLVEWVMKTHVASHSERSSFLWSPPSHPGHKFLVHLAPFDRSGGDERLALVTLLDRDAFDADASSLRSEMLRDILTGLPNRRSFTDTIDGMIAESGETGGFAVLTVNLVRFSGINEAIGSLAADALIAKVARRLVRCIREGNMLARLIGDEFGVLVRLVDGPGDALHVARQLQEALVAPFRLDGLELRLDCAIGCAVWHDGAATSHDIVRNAQFALKRAKRTGHVEVYEPGEVGRAQRRFNLETDLRRAIEGDHLTLAFQPLVDLCTGAVKGFEALARWRHPEHGAIPPTEFIAVAEEAGLIVPLGRWALDRAAATMKAWDVRAGRVLPIYVGVNVSPVQLARDRVGVEVEAALRRHGISGDRLTLELTESSIVADPVRAAGVLNALKALSCRIAMDDFGTGHSCLASLQRLPIDVLKIDRQFVGGMLHDRDSLAIIRAILGLAKALGMATIAEGIESASVAHALAQLKTDVGQGYYFAKPMPEDAALAFVLARSPPV